MKKHVTADVDAPIGALVPYYLKGPKQSLLYNGVRIEVDSGIPTARRLGINHLPNK